MLRLTLLTAFITFLCFYAWRDWYKALCGLVVLMAVIEHPDMPKSIMGIQGLNPWNITFVFVFFAWLASKRREGLAWDMPKYINLLMLIYFGLICAGFLRMLFDYDGRMVWAAYQEGAEETTGSLISEYIINTFKWVIPGSLLFHGCNSRKRLVWAITSVLLVYILLSIQVIRWMPISALTDGGKLDYYGLKMILPEIGYHRVNLSMMLSGAFWAVVSVVALYPFFYRRMLGISTLLIFLGMALTGGRMGYATWAAVGAVISFVKWRKYLIIAPIILIAIITILPATKERFTQGFEEDTAVIRPVIEEYVEGSMIELQLYTITSGRSFAWPFVIDKIEQSPIIGYGREAMVRLGISTFLWEKFSERFPHPHNAYLMWLLDNGWLGLIPVLLFYLLVIKYSLSLLRDKRDPVFVAVGGMAFALTSALLIASFGSQTFYPREGSVGMWCAIGLMLRVYVERAKLISGKITDSRLVDFRPQASASKEERASRDASVR